MILLQNIGKLIKKPSIVDGIIVLSDQGFLTLATFTTGILVARAGSKEDYGVYVLAWSFLLMAQGFHRALVSMPFTIYLPRLDEGQQRIYFGSTFLYTLLFGAAGVVILMALVASGDEGDRMSGGLLPILPAIAIILVPQLTREFIRNALLAHLDVRASVGVSILSTAILLPAVIVAFFAGHLDAATAFYLMALTSTVATLFMLWTHRNRIAFRLCALWPDFQRGWAVSRWAMINVVLFMAASQAYPWLILLLQDTGSVAAFGACFAVASVLTPLLRGSTAYILPRMSHGYKGSNYSNLRRLTNLSMLVLSIPFGVWLIIGLIMGDKLVTLLYGTTYVNHGLLFVLLLIRVTITSISAPQINALQALERQDANTVSLAIGAAVTISIGTVLIMKLGVEGAAMAGILSAAATATWRWYALQTIFRQRMQAQADTGA